MAGLAQAGEALTAPLVEAARPGLARRLWQQPSGRTGLIILAVMVLAGLASLAGLAPAAPDAQNPSVTLHGPSAAHLFGTDQFGRDVLSRVMAGTLLSLQTALLAVAICAVVGTLGGVAAGYFGGAVSWAVTSLAERARRLYAKAGYAPDGSTRVEPEYEATEVRLVKVFS